MCKCSTYIFIRENAEIIKAGATKKHIAVDIDRLLAVDDERKLLRQELDANARSRDRPEQRNQHQKGRRARKVIEAMQHLKAGHDGERGEAEDGNGGVAETGAHGTQYSDMSVPDGAGDADNLEVKKWGTPDDFSFTPKDHVEPMTALDVADFERGAKVAGFRGYFLKGDGVLLANAVWQLALKHFPQKEWCR